ncbi:beta-1,3-glucan-binding protein-like [Diadema antillarum]|uniref:beta-1,3-glucan-binding protein-like n=1 Tax=Diadema antillarum TaxID=105358 RepID=UPI003A8A5C65
MEGKLHLVALLAAFAFFAHDGGADATQVVYPLSYQVQTPQISLVSPQGIRFAYPHEDGVSLVAYHYNINRPLNGVAAGDYNYDVTEPTGNYWVHEKTDINPQIGDTVYYWVYVVYNGVGYQLLEQSWAVPAVAVIALVMALRKEDKSKMSSYDTKSKSINMSESNLVPEKKSESSFTMYLTLLGVVFMLSVAAVAVTALVLAVREKNATPLQCSAYPCDASCDMNTAPCDGLIFNEQFDDFNLDIWEHEITAGGGGNWEFEYYTNNRSNSYVRDGVLFLKPTLTEDNFGEGYLTWGTLSLWGASPANLCTGNAWYGCERVGNGNNYLNPIQSARIRTVDSFSFKYGRLEVQAKMPTGDWIWPAIWLLPKHGAYGEWPASGEIDLVEARGNTDLRDATGTSVGVDQVGSTMHWGPFWPYNGYPKTHATKNLADGETFGNSFHKFVLDWTPSDLKFYIDDDLILTVNPPTGFWDLGDFGTEAPGIENPWANSPNKLTPFDQEFYIILNVAVGGVNYFADGLQGTAKPWLNTSPTASKDFYLAKDAWYPTWNPDTNNGEDAAMQVNYIKVYANDYTTYHLRDR